MICLNILGSFLLVKEMFSFLRTKSRVNDANRKKDKRAQGNCQGGREVKKQRSLTTSAAAALSAIAANGAEAANSAASSALAGNGAGASALAGNVAGASAIAAVDANGGSAIAAASAIAYTDDVSLQEYIFMVFFVFYPTKFFSGPFLTHFFLQKFFFKMCRGGGQANPTLRYRTFSAKIMFYFMPMNENHK